MKKLMLWVALLGFGSSTLFAQTPTTTAMPAKAKTEAAKPVASAKSTHGGNSATPMKKDGTPDKRYKHAKHMKKDGTPDKRFKEHKAEKPAAPATK